MTDGSLGLPTLPTDPTGRPASDRERPYVEYTLPTEYLGMEWPGSGFSDADRTFRMIELTPAAQQQAMRFAGKDQVKASDELTMAAIWQVGDWRARPNREKLERWYAAIGGKSRKLLQAAFVALNAVEDEETERFLASGRPRP